MKNLIQGGGGFSNRLLLCSALVLSLGVVSALGQAAGLTHYYSFSTDATDSVGGANGTLKGNAMVTNGGLTLDGASSYVALPSGLVSGYSNITIEVWVTDNGSLDWARIYDFGSGTTRYMFLTLPSGSGNLKGTYTTNSAGGEQPVQWTNNRPPVGQKTQIVWTSNSTNHLGLLYVNGALVGSNTSLTLTPANLGNTTNNWLGRSQYSDPYFKGSISDLSIYNTALSPSAVYQDYQNNQPAPLMPIYVQDTVEGSNVVLTFNANIGMWYWVQREDSFVPSTWQDLGGAPIQATSTNMTYVDVGAAADPFLVYRVLQLTSAPPGLNVALVATASTSYASPWQTVSSMNNGYTPTSSSDSSQGAYGNWPETTTNWVEYDWPDSVSTSKMAVYWWADGAGIAPPSSYSIQYWNGSAFAPVSNPSGLGAAPNQYNTTTFTPVTTTRMRLVIVPSGATSGNGISTGILQWVVYDDGNTSNFPPIANAGGDRDLIIGGNTYLTGSATDDGKIYIKPVITWNVLSGPGSLSVSNNYASNTTATVSSPGSYVIQMNAFDGQYTNSSTLNLNVVPTPPLSHLLPVYNSTYQINSPLWSYRLKNTLIHWIPHLYAQLNNTNLAQGNIFSFMQASNKLNGHPYTVPSVDPYADAYTLNTVEAMSDALMYDPQGDASIIAAQAAFKTNLAYWIPIILSAQWTNGYIHTYTTLRGYAPWSINTDHEGYVAGYFIEAGIANYLASGMTDPTLYNAAKKEANCWFNNIGPGKAVPIWFDGHENMEQALVHLGRFMNEYEGEGAGSNFISLAKYLMDCRGTPAANALEHDGSTYDQSQAPVTHQYEIVGHAVRAEYLSSAMEDVAMETGDVDYQSAALSLFDNFVNKKFYVTGGAGSGETSEGFGNNYSLPNSSYCETCAGCGTLFFFHKMNLAYADAKYADLMENVLFNEVLGSLDDQANDIFYPNPLNSGAARVSWTGVPCCYGNAPRTLFMLPSWIYARSTNGIYVNQFIGSSINVPNISGTTVQMVQTTSYPWSNTVAIVVNPSVTTNFTLYVRVPNRAMSTLYTPAPAVGGLTSIALNGVPFTPTIVNGYAVINRAWTAGDEVDVVLPMVIQRVTASSKIPADVGLVALQYGPLIYNIESADQDITQTLSSSAPLSLQWNGSLLGGLMEITGTFTNGATLTAIPNYARLNRGGSTAVWFKGQ